MLTAARSGALLRGLQRSVTMIGIETLISMDKLSKFSGGRAYRLMTIILGAKTGYAGLSRPALPSGHYLEIKTKSAPGASAR